MQMNYASKLTIAIQVAQAVLFLHSAEPPTVHLDIKPANILVCIQVQFVFVPKSSIENYP